MDQFLRVSATWNDDRDRGRVISRIPHTNVAESTIGFTQDTDSSETAGSLDSPGRMESWLGGNPDPQDDSLLLVRRA
jgi:hypothetical protein